MKREITLETLLIGQDLSPMKTCARVLNDEPCDSLTNVIVNAWRNNLIDKEEQDIEGYIADLIYAKNQLQKAIDTIVRVNTSKYRDL